MRITLCPVRMDLEHPEVHRTGDILTLDGVAFDFAPLPEGGVLPADAIDSKWFRGPVSRIDGDIHLTLLLPHGPNAPEATRFPETLILEEDGPVDLPPYDEEPTDE